MIKLSIRRPVLTMVTMLLVIVLGAVSLVNIPLKLIPEINPPIGVVVATYDQAGPEEVNDQVTIPIEESLSTTTGLDTMASTAQEGSSLTLLQFGWATDINDVEGEISQALDNVQLPDGAGDPSFLKFDPSQLPIIQMSVSSELEELEFQGLVEELSEELERIDGVASVDAEGLTTETIEIQLDSDEMENYQLEMNTLQQMLAASDISLPGTTISDGTDSITTRIQAQMQSIEDLEAFPVTIDPEAGEEVTLGDISEIVRVSDSGETISRTNQNPSVLINVLEESNGNTSQVSGEFLDVLESTLDEPRFEGIEGDVLFDQGDYINRSIQDIATALILGAVFAMVVLFLFLRNVRSPIIIGIAIPYSVIFTFVLMYFSDFTLNLLTMGGLALGVGMLVDNSIVVIENINRHLGLGKTPKEAAYEGAREVAAAITASTFTTIAVFLPVLFIEGIIGQIFTQFSLTVAFSLLASLIVALTVVPMFASKFMKTVNTSMEEKRRRSIYNRIIQRMLKFALRFRLLTFLIVGVLVALGAFGIYRTGMIFLPETDESFFTANIDMTSGTNLETTEAALLEMEEYLLGIEEVDVFLAMAGASDTSGIGAGGEASQGSIYVTTVPPDERERSTNEVVDEVSEELQSIAENYVEDAEVSMMTTTSTGTDSSVLTFDLMNSSEQDLEEDEEKITRALGEMDSVTRVSNNTTDTIDELAITLDHDALFENGLAASEVASTFNNMTTGMDVFMVLDESTEEYLMVRMTLPDEDVDSEEALGDMVISRTEEGAVTLDEVATVDRQPAPSAVERINGQHAYQYELELEPGANLSEAVTEMQDIVNGLDLSSGSNLSFTGDQELIEDSIMDMIMAMILAVILVFLVMAAQFESFKYPFVIMFTIPLSAVGVMLGLWLTDTPLSVPVFIGMLVLIGIVVNNGIVLVDFINQLRARGMNAYEAIIEAVDVRTRPIFMTAFTTILGLVPIAIGLGEGSEINQPMGISVIGGLLASTLLTLVIVPVVYSLFTKETLTMNRKKNRDKFNR
ncbi:efflux RND transporter permease subunit [Salinicoccus halitifaciens]|uniref:HAE1 family hydrophobic/amphiphilic exporter-1 n=1 Tax=Salinicoccus halitifaciens TaxID=1073415 RepID=A0ABV2EA97_9STAP|nr:efflux RND transporter permease subunit [Salinicoccus halitifaciens]MCD2138484.1 efflux RND transporter permease subunit [Salinicoccus halitifaciens]